MVPAIGTRIDPPEAGATTTAGTAGQAVAFSTALPDTDYHVSISCETDPAGGLGACWIGDKTTAGFTLYNDGASGLTVTYAVTRY